MPLTTDNDYATCMRMEDSRWKRIITPMPDSLIKAIEDYRFENRFASRAEAVRHLIEMGIKAAKSAIVPPKKSGK
jgi:hypothetical protein